MTVETRNGSRRSAARSISSLADLVRTHDRDRYQTALFAPAERRAPLFALYAFNYEVARVRESVTQPTLGQIRLQWWRDVVDAAYAGTAPRQHVVAQPLAAMVREFSPSRAYFDRIIDTRERDLADQPPADLAALEDYAEGTATALLCLALEVLGGSDVASRAVVREIGIGYGLAGLLRAMPFHARAGRCYVPTEFVERAGADPREYLRLSADTGLRAAVAELAQTAATHLRTARHSRVGMTRSTRAALLPAVVADRFLARLAKAGFNPFAPELALPDTLQSWRLFAATLRRRF